MSTFPITTGEAARVLAVPPWRVMRCFENGLVPEPDRIGGRRMIDRRTLRRLKAKLQAKES